ncbi:MAG: RagB/SusD family nutrient uptake outer membrane protein [Paludibacteraceae bacterium]
MDLYPEDQLSTETFFTSEVEMRQYTNYFYCLMPDPETMYAEEGEHFTAPVANDIMQGIRNIHSADGYWNSSTWRVLRKINYCLDNAYRCKDEDARRHYVGVAHFFRAYFYYGMLQRFGAVPWYEHAINADDADALFKPQDSREVIIRHIIADLDSAVLELPDLHTPYEVNKWTALALKSRACLFEGTFRKYHAGTTFNGGSTLYSEVLPYEYLLEECISASEKLMRESGYALYTKGSEPYRMLFASAEANTDEVIWARIYSKELNIKHNAQGWSVARQTGFTKRFTNLYLMKDGSPFTDKSGYDTITYVNEFEGRDERMAQTIHAPGYIQMGDSKTYPVNLAQTYTGYKYIKYIMESAYNNWDASITAMPLFRLAEVYLNYAEARCELGQLTQSDLDMTINRLRERGGVATLSMSAASDTYLSEQYGFHNPVLVSHPMRTLLLEIRRERMVEMPLEGVHYWDIMRWKEGHVFTMPRYGAYFPREGKYDLTGDGKNNVLITSDPNEKAGIGVTKLILGQDIILSNGTSGNMVVYPDQVFIWNEDKDYLYPIPLQERMLTAGALQQNPGWVDDVD